MSREIKFRVWSDNMWLDGGDANIHPVNRDETTIELKASYPHKEHVMCQYTGLKDSKGKEIYEGDIVKSHTSMPLTLYTHPKGYSEVVFDCGYFGVRDLGSKYGRVSNVCMVQPDDWLDVEVIGNVWENPELLG